MSELRDVPPEPPDRGDFGHRLDERLQYPPMFPPKSNRPSTATIILFVTIGCALLIGGLVGMEWAALHKPTLANALSGRQLYSDADVIQILSIVALLVGIASIAYPIIRAVRAK